MTQLELSSEPEKQGKTSLITVPQKEVYQYWPLIAGYIHEVCLRSGGKFTEKDYRISLIDGTRQCWLGIDPETNIIKAVCLTEVITYPGMKSLYCDVCTGYDHKSWMHYILAIEAWARSIGCEMVEMAVRRGLAEPLKDLKYKETHILLEKRI